MKLKRSSLLVKLVILVLVVYSVVTLVSLQQQTDEMNAQREQLENQILITNQANSQLKDNIEQVDTDEAVADIARSKLGLVSSDEIVFYDIGG